MAEPVLPGEIAGQVDRADHLLFAGPDQQVGLLLPAPLDLEGAPLFGEDLHRRRRTIEELDPGPVRPWIEQRGFRKPDPPVLHLQRRHPLERRDLPRGVRPGGLARQRQKTRQGVLGGEPARLEAREQELVEAAHRASSSSKAARATTFSAFASSESSDFFRRLSSFAASSRNRSPSPSPSQRRSAAASGASSRSGSAAAKSRST